MTLMKMPNDTNISIANTIHMAKNKFDDVADSLENGITWHGEHRPRSCFWSKTDLKFFDTT